MAAWLWWVPSHEWRACVADRGPAFSAEDRQLVEEHMPFLLLSEEGEAALLECLDHGDMLVHAAVEVYHEEHDDHDFQDTLRRVAQRAVSVGAVTQPLTKKASETDMPAGLALDEEEDGADEDHVAFEGRDVITSVRAWLRVVGVRGLLGGVDDTLPCCAHTHTVARPARCGR